MPRPGSRCPKGPSPLGQLDGEDGGCIASQLDRPTMGVDHLVHDVESEPRAVARTAAPERLEEMRAQLLGNGLAAVCDAQLSGIADVWDCQVARRVLFALLPRFREQIAPDLCQAVRIPFAVHVGACRLEPERAVRISG